MSAHLTETEQLDTLKWALAHRSFWVSIASSGGKMFLSTPGDQTTLHEFTGSFQSQIEQLCALRVAERLKDESGPLVIDDGGMENCHNF